MSGARRVEAEDRGMVRQPPADRPGVRVEQELVAVEAQAQVGLPGAVGAEAVARARCHARDLAVPDAERPLGELVAGLDVAVVEEADPHPRRLRGVDREVGRLLAPVRPEGPGAARPDVGRLAATAPHSGGHPRHCVGRSAQCRWKPKARAGRAGRDHRDESRRHGGVRAARGQRRRRHDPARPAEDERPQRPGAGGDPRRRGRGHGTRRRQGGRGLRRREGLRGRRRHQGDGRHVLRRHGAAQRRAPVVVHERRPHPQARGRGDHRLRAGRWLRAGPVRGRALRRRRRRPRSAGDPARHHPGRRRHPAADPPGGPEPRQGHHLQRSLREGRRGAGDRPRRPRRTRRPGVRRGRGVGGSVRAGGDLRRCARPRKRSTSGSRPTSTPAWPSSASSSPPCSRPTTARSG